MPTERRVEPSQPPAASEGVRRSAVNNNNDDPSCNTHFSFKGLPYVLRWHLSGLTNISETDQSVSWYMNQHNDLLRSSHRSSSRKQKRNHDFPLEQHTLHEDSLEVLPAPLFLDSPMKSPRAEEAIAFLCRSFGRLVTLYRAILHHGLHGFKGLHSCATLS